MHQTASGELAVYRDTVLLGTSVGAGISTADWKFVEFKVVCRPAVYEVQLNGTTVLTSGVNTQQGPDAFHDRVLIGGALPLELAFDDFYVLDGAGSVNSNFLGNNEVVAIFPDAARRFDPVDEQRRQQLRKP